MFGVKFTSRTSAGAARVVTRAVPVGSTPVAPTPSAPSASRDAQHIKAQAAFAASLEKVVGAHKGSSVLHSEAVVAQLALQNSSAARLQRQTHLNTLNMSSFEEDSWPNWPQQQAALPLSQLAFKALLRASLAAARLHHGFLTSPHLLLGLVSAGSSSLVQAAPTAAGSSTVAGSSSEGSSSEVLAAAAEAAVVRLIDGRAPAAAAAAAGDRGGQQGVAAVSAAAAASLVGRACGLDVVQWVHQLSDPARAVLLEAEELRVAQGCPLLTSHHLVAALLQQPAGGSSKRPVVQQLLSELGYDGDQVAAEAAAAAVLGAAAAAAAAAARPAAAAAAADEDVVPCEPLGFLHEEFYGSLCAELAPAPGGHNSSSSSSSPCLN